MKLIALNCQQCGAPLSVPEEVKHVTCMHCGTQLGVVHEGGAAYTEKLTELDERTSEIESQVEDLQRQRRLDALDREWKAAQQSLLIYEKDGQLFRPRKEQSYTGISGSVIFAIIPPIVAITSNVDWYSVLVIAGGCALIGLVGVLFSLYLYLKAAAFDDAEERYRRRRAKLFEQ
ncbi:hypothetical protein [Blastopirellula marina]|uniref:Uncharacterized protein n=1 Tax=Blastopirellula marina TaxID=124 RepID=A0A2S8GMB7_9BACT|nr:hypothetical protein [Blastopirellula marina]PQO45583.1 hypothetical protein C5Y93_14175 [Blastopirellula marina]